MKVLLVYPEFPETYWSFKHALAFEGKLSAFPPLGLMTVAAMLPADWEKRLVDMNVESLDDSDIEWADMVFTSAMLVQKDSLLDVVERARHAGKRVAVGGPYVSTTLDELTGDHTFVGEVEDTLPEFLHDLALGIPQAVYRSDVKPALTATPVPDFALAKLDRYSAMSVQYSRGCPFQCEFCDIIEIYGRVPRTKTGEQMLAELDALHDAGWTGLVFIVDDNFIGNKKSVKTFLPELAEWSRARGQPFSFITEASLNLAEDEQLLGMMRDAGFRRVFLGIETPVEESLIEAQKKQNTRGNLLDSVELIQSYGMEVMAGFILGFDSDPEDIFKLQVDFIRESAIPLAMVGLLTALPDTGLWRRLEKEGRLLTQSTGNNTDCSLNFIPKMDATRLVEGYKQVLQTIYSSREYYDRALKCLARVVQSGPEPRHSTFRGDLSALVRIFMRLGVLDSERREFWRFIRSTISHHREQFADAIRLAAMGYHFRKLTEANCR